MTITEKAELAESLERMLFVIENNNGEFWNQATDTWEEDINKAHIYKGYKQAIKRVNFIKECPIDFIKSDCHLVQIEIKKVE